MRISSCLERLWYRDMDIYDLEVLNKWWLKFKKHFTLLNHLIPVTIWGGEGQRCSPSLGEEEIKASVSCSTWPWIFRIKQSLYLWGGEGRCRGVFIKTKGVRVAHVLRQKWAWRSLDSGTYKCFEGQWIGVGGIAEKLFNAPQLSFCEQIWESVTQCGKPSYSRSGHTEGIQRPCVINTWEAEKTQGLFRFCNLNFLIILPMWEYSFILLCLMTHKIWGLKETSNFIQCNHQNSITT